MSLPNLEQLLPHRAPMLLLDRLIEADTEHAVGEARPRADGLFNEGDRVPSLIAIEYIAQTVGALAGLRHRDQGRAPQPGYLIAVRELTLQRPWLRVGACLSVHVRCIWSDGRAGQFEGTVLDGAETIANATVTVYEPPTQPSEPTP